MSKTSTAVMTLCGCLLLAPQAWGQLGGLTSGYVYESTSRELRPMRGAAGMAHLGDALVKDADSASVSNDGTLAAVARAGKVTLLRGFDAAQPGTVELAGEPGTVLFAWSGRDLAAVFPASRKAMIWRGIDAGNDGLTLVNLANVEGDIRQVLLDSEGLVLAANGGLYLSRRGETSRIQTLAEPSAMILAGNDLYVADQGAGQVLQIRNYGGKAEAISFAAIGQPVGLQMAGRNLLVASAQTRSVEAFDLATKERTSSLELDFLPTRMEALGGRALALLNQGSADEPLYVLDAKDSLHVYFVPSGRNQ